jgi:hypothetical protein
MKALIAKVLVGACGRVRLGIDMDQSGRWALQAIALGLVLTTGCGDAVQDDRAGGASVREGSATGATGIAAARPITQHSPRRRRWSPPPRCHPRRRRRCRRRLRQPSSHRRFSSMVWSFTSSGESQGSRGSGWLLVDVTGGGAIDGSSRGALYVPFDVVRWCGLPTPRATTSWWRHCRFSSSLTRWLAARCRSPMVNRRGKGCPAATQASCGPARCLAPTPLVTCPHNGQSGRRPACGPTSSRCRGCRWWRAATSPYPSLTGSRLASNRPIQRSFKAGRRGTRRSPRLCAGVDRRTVQRTRTRRRC